MPRQDLPQPGLRERAVASDARTVSGNSGTLRGYGQAKTIRAQLDVTAVTGVAPTLDVVIEDTLDDGATWNTIGTFTQRTAVGRQVIDVTTPFSDTVRFRWTMGGTTPSFTFAIDQYTE